MGKSKAAISAAEKIDRDLAWAAREKQHRGDRPTRDELIALKRIEKLDEESTRWLYYRTIPKKHWREMSGRSAQVLNDQAERYGIPVGSRTVNLVDLAKWIHDFIAENSAALGKAGAKSRAADELERLRRAQAEEREMRNAIRRGELRHIDEVRQTFEFVANTIRRASSELRTEFGDRPHEILAAAIDEAAEILAKFERQNDSDD